MKPAMPNSAFDALDEETLRKRRSAKWAYYPRDVLPAWIAEMDFPLAEPLARVLHEAIEAGDAGYASAVDLGDTVAAWMKETWAVSVDGEDVHLAPDVVTAITEVLRVATEPGEPVLIEPPVYPPFAGTILALDRRVVTAPVLRTPHGFEPNLDSIEREYANGVRAHLLCSPHNPTGLVYSAAALERIAGLADRYGVLVLADEIHAPLTYPDAAHTPFLAVSEQSRRRSITISSASKTWNIAGLKAAWLIGVGDAPRAVLTKLGHEMAYRAGHLGVLATRAALREGQAWRADAIATLDRNRFLLGELLREALPGIEYVPPRAGYLAWLDCRGLGLGPDPAQTFLAQGKVALSSGPTFGVEGRGFARLNIATSRGLLEEAVRRMARAARGR
jgi:cystathionine beta-lyase